MVVSVIWEKVQVYCWLHQALLSEPAYIYICSLLYNAHFCHNGIANSSVLGLGMLVYCQTFEAWSSLVAVLVVVVLVIAV